MKRSSDAFLASWLLMTHEGYAERGNSGWPADLPPALKCKVALVENAVWATQFCDGPHVPLPPIVKKGKQS